MGGAPSGVLSLQLKGFETREKPDGKSQERRQRLRRGWAETLKGGRPRAPAEQVKIVPEHSRYYRVHSRLVDSVVHNVSNCSANYYSVNIFSSPIYHSERVQAHPSVSSALLFLLPGTRPPS